MENVKNMLKFFPKSEKILPKTQFSAIGSAGNIK